MSLLMGLSENVLWKCERSDVMPVCFRSSSIRLLRDPSGCVTSVAYTVASAVKTWPPLLRQGENLLSKANENELPFIFLATCHRVLMHSRRHD